MQHSVEVPSGTEQMPITIFENIQKELRIDAATGVGYCSIRGAARICGVDEQALRKSLKTGADFIASKMVQSLIAQGFEGADFIEFSVSGIPDSALALIVHYYAIEAGARCTDEARAALLAFTAIGIRTVIQNVCNHAPTPTPNALPPSDVRLHNMVSSLQAIGLDLSNPRFQQGLQDLAVDMLGIARPALPAATTVYLGVVEKAQELGYPIALVDRFRSQLGKYVASIGLPSQKEKRLCNGTQRPINVYLDSPALSVAVCEFMDAKTLATANGGSI